MKSLSKMVCFTFVVSAALGLKANVLYWQVNNNPQNYNYAALVAVDKSGNEDYVQLVDQDGKPFSTPAYAAPATSSGTGVQYADVSAYGSDYSFYIEMLNWDGSEFTEGWTSPTMTYDSLSNYISDGSISAGSVNAWTASVTIPEPTSGLLLLVGGSLLALRRKRRA